MQLGTKGRYAVMAMIELADCEHGFALHLHSKPNSKPIPLSLIAEHQGISLLYLEQIFSKLRKKGLVQSMRGVTGGYVLAKPMSQISIAEIMDAVGEKMHFTRCSPKSQVGCMQNQARCKVHHVWEELEQRMYQYLRSVSLNEIYQNPSKL